MRCPRAPSGIAADTARPTASAADRFRVYGSSQAPLRRRKAGLGERRHRDASHLTTLPCGAVIPAQQVQEPMDTEQRELRICAMAMHLRLTNDGRPRDRKIAEMPILALKRQNVGDHVVR